MLPDLPDKYYLNHAKELFTFVQNDCAHLLNQTHRTYLQTFAQISESAQCLLIRFLARKPRFIKASSLIYPEINPLGKAISELIDAQYISHVTEKDWSQFVAMLTKPELKLILKAKQIHVKSATHKSELVQLAGSVCRAENHIEIRRQYLVRRQQQVVDYIFFLFFGDLRNRFQKFAMRDLGVLKTRNSPHRTIPRFEGKAEALSAFEMQLHRREFRQAPDLYAMPISSALLARPAMGHSAQETKDKLLVAIGEHVAESDSAYAIRLWKHSNEPKATEKWVRASYANGCRDTLKRELSSLRDQNLPAASAVFIEDFYARKYLGKRTSAYTDMLREAKRVIQVDEVYLNQVEEGVLQHYLRQGCEAYFTENKLWYTLFAFTFWPILFGEQEAHYGEFDRLPKALKDGNFYQARKDQIEQRLALLDRPHALMNEFTKLATQHYGYPTGIFRWTPDLLNNIEPCLRLSPEKSIASVLRRMAINYREAKDGYPDLMVIENNQLRFEEIKAPGDSLRANQLVSINRLRKAGFFVDVSQVEWSTDPKQEYAVVDIETTGGRRGGHAITEIAVVKVRSMKIVGEWSSLINPQRAIPKHISQLTGITNSMVANAPVFSEIADTLEQQLKNSIFVAHNVGFDYGFIKSAYDSINRPFRKPKFCTVANSRKTFPGLKSYSLSNLTEYFDISLENHHRALSDATATAHLLRLIQETRGKNIKTFV